MKTLLHLCLVPLLCLNAACGKGFRSQATSSVGIGSRTQPLPGESSPNDPPQTTLPPALPPNSKVFVKNPLFQGASQFYRVSGAGTIPSTPINYDKYFIDAHIDPGPTGFLENDSFVVQRKQYDDPSGRAQPDAKGLWSVSTSSDSQHFLGQILSFHWLTAMEEHFNKILTGGWQGSHKKVDIYTHCTPEQNAYWSGFETQFICLGYVGNMKLAYDGSVTVHEMGHGHLSFATNGQIEQDTRTVRCMVGSCCPDAKGCAAALNEGQADVHSQILFSSGNIGEFAFGPTNGIPGRNAEKNSTLRADTMFNGSAIDPVTGDPYGALGAEIHYLGAVWAVAWWSLRKELGKDITAQLFLKHLPYLSGDDTFETAASMVLLADKELFASKYKTKIVATFQRHGISAQ